LNEDEDDFDQEELDCMTDQAIQSNWDDGIGINTVSKETLGIEEQFALKIT
jgi:hypothetical protein